MADDDKPVLIYVTCPDLEVAERIGGALVDGGLAACVNILPGMIAIYRWQGQRCRDSEVVLIVKTREQLCERATAAIRSSHPYDNPAILVIPIVGGSTDYLSWLAAQAAGVPRAEAG